MVDEVYKPLMDKPLISIVIPVYNSSKTIIRCVDSVVKQSYKNTELIIIDDGSTDNTFGDLMIYRKNCKYLNLYIYKQANKGPSAARNKGIIASKGDYVAFLDSDDYWLPNKLEEQISYLQKYDIALMGCLCVKKKSFIVTDKKRVKVLSFKALLFKNYFCTSSVICKTTVVKEYMFDENQKYSEDYKLWLSIAKTHKIAILNQCLIIPADKLIYGDKGLSSKLWMMEKGEVSNYLHLYIEKKVSIILFMMAVGFSFIKYCKRFIHSQLYKMINNSIRFF